MPLTPEIKITAFGEARFIREWVRDPRCHATRQTLLRRIKDLGWNPEKAITTPTKAKPYRIVQKPRMSKHGDMSSKYVGVSWHKCQEVWQATIRVKGKLVHLGYFPTEREAAKVRDFAAIEYGMKQKNAPGLSKKNALTQRILESNPLVYKWN